MTDVADAKPGSGLPRREALKRIATATGMNRPGMSGDFLL